MQHVNLRFWDLISYHIKHEFREDRRSQQLNAESPGHGRHINAGWAAADDESGTLSRLSLNRPDRQLPSRIDNTVSLIPGGRPIFEEPFLNILLQRLVLQRPATSVNTVAATRLAKRSPILENGLLALSTHVVASELQDAVIVQDGLKRYERTIGALRTTIGSGYITQATKSHFESIMLTSMACAKYELLANYSLINMGRHVQGLGVLFQHYGVENIMSEEMRDLFHEVRTLEVTICLTIFRDSFLGSATWKNPAWGAESPTASSTFQKLLDLVFDLTPILPGWKHFKEASMAAEANFLENVHEGLHYLKKFLRCIDQLEEWLIYTNAAQGEQLFQHRPAMWGYETDSHLSCFSYTYTYFDFSVAMAVTFYEAILVRVIGLISNTYGLLRQVMAESVLIQLTEEQHALLEETRTLLSGGKLYESATRICKSLEYFFEDDKALIGPNMFEIFYEEKTPIELKVTGNIPAYAA
ncbi:MAG: hypothetical protein L6R37_002961 [Teloschistes peruensis]|nr:MAG: hypothetical protein L6R37_002961 [Teloschistes peruensis]